MIKANELRIGNWLLNNINNQPFPVTSIEFEWHYNIRFESISHLEKGCDPIPLTSEVLDKCGFESKVTGIHAILTPDLSYKFTVHYVGDGHYFSSNATSNRPLLFLHELQNLYYALTGEELTYTP